MIKFDQVEKLLSQPNDTLYVDDSQRSPGDSYVAMPQRSKSRKYAFPYLYDESQAIAFGASNAPHMFFVKKEDNEYRVAYIGAIDNNQGDGSSASKKYVADAVKE
ncbi:hypothetical protein GCM10028805_14180 [Spirosoma harenae]